MAISQVELERHPDPHKENVFNLSLYSKLPPEVRTATIIEDLAGLVLEAGDSPLEARINARKLVIIDGKIYDPNNGKEVSQGWKYDTELAKKESLGAARFWGAVLEHESAVVISKSPSGGISPYEEARINAAFRKGRGIEFYGIPSHMTPLELLNFSWRLSEFSQVSAPFNNPDDLREIAFSVMVPGEEDPKEFLRDNFPLDSDAWQAIIEGKPWGMKARSRKDAGLTVGQSEHLFARAETAADFVLIGAYMERVMHSLGWELNKAGCPGKFNTDLLALATIIVQDAFGNLRVTSWEQYKHHLGTCIVCGAQRVELGPCDWCKSCSKKSE
ncbi:MAG: hypothetical protein Q7S60_03575 [bacterium]|nr:hypothetical protein [bacterium]